MENFKSYLDGINFNSRFEKLKKKLKNKSVLIYGAGIFFQYINKNYDLSSLKITGICDKKFNYDARGYYEGYKTLFSFVDEIPSVYGISITSPPHSDITSIIL